MAISRTDHGTVTSWSVSGSDRTVSGSVVGAVASDCIVVVYVGHERGSVQSATIGGVTANVVSDVYSVLGTAIVWAEVTSGTVPDTVLTFDVTNASFPIAAFSTVTGMEATAYADNSGGANGTSVSTTLDIPANGAAFSIAYLRTGGSAAWTGLTEVDEENGTLNGRSGTTAGDTGMSAETGRSISVTWGAAHVTSLTAVSFEEASGGATTVTGSGGVTSPAPTLSGAGSAASTTTGTGAVSTPVVALSGSGNIEKTASGAITAPTPSLSGSGSVQSTASGTGAIQTPSPALSGTGTVARIGSGGVTAPTPDLSGTGAIDGAIIGTGAINAPSPSLSGSGLLGRTAAGAITAPAPILSGAGIGGDPVFAPSRTAQAADRSRVAPVAPDNRTAPVAPEARAARVLYEKRTV